MRNTALIITALLISVISFSQTGSIDGKLKDSLNRRALSLATITVFKAKDTSIVTYRLSNQEGVFKVGSLPLDVPLRMVITFSGYNPHRTTFTLTASNNNLHFDSILLAPSSKLLDEVMVMAERPPVTVKNDTIEFNASAFKTLPNALVEDLLKKLPGIQVDKDGNIMANGKTVNRILVDGKTFFGDDPKMATRNLPANVIDKVQVTDDKEEMLRRGDDNANNVGKVINITLKKGVKKGWFGKLYAGGGSDKRFEAGGIANVYRDTLQVSVLGYANNLNKPGFSYSELMQAGGLDRTRSNLSSNSTSIWNNGSGSGISINGVNFGGAQNYGGIATSRGVGVNLNHAPNLKKSLFAQYFYGDIHIDRLTQTDVNQYNQDTIINQKNTLTGDVITHAQNMGFGGRLKPDSVTNILFNINYSIGMQDEDRFSNIGSINNKLGSLSNGNINQFNNATTHYYRHSFSYTGLSKTKKGRRLTFSHGLDINNRVNDYSTDALTHFINPSPYDSLLQQLRMEKIPRTDAYASVTYSEPLNKIFTLRFSSRYEYGKLKNAVNTFNPNAISKEYDVLNTSLSSNFSRESNRLNSALGFEFKWKNLTLTPTVRALYQKADNRLASLASPILQKQFNILPAFSLVYKQLNFNYDKGIVLPNYTYLIPVTDNTNPYYIVKGNPGLLSAERNNFSINYFYNNTKKSLNASINGGGSYTNNDVVQNITVDSRGIQTTYPVNANGSSSYWLNYNLNRQYKTNPKFNFSWNFGAYYSYDKNKLLFNNESSFQNTYYINQWAGLNLNFNDKFEWNPSYSLGYNFTKYTTNTFKKLEVLSHYLETEFIVRYPKHVIWETNYQYTYRDNIPDGLPKDAVRWNAAINFTMLKGEVGVLKIAAYDILNRSNNISTSVVRNMTTTTSGNILGQYFMATFTYNIRPTGASKKVGGSRLFLF